MQTRRDQLQAYRFQNRRALAALVTGEPNLLDPPMRRLTVTTISGFMIAVLVTVGFTVFGLIRPKAGDSWKETGSVIVEQDTGATFVYIDGVLHGVVNYTSAVLAVSKGQQAKTVEVERDDIGSAKRGAAIGIIGLPTTLPSPDDLVTSPIAFCSREQTTAGSDDITAKVTVNFGQVPTARAVPASKAVVVNTGTGTTNYLLYDGQRLAIGSGRTATALGLADAPALQVGTAFLNAVPPGTALTPPIISGAGNPAGLTGVNAVVGQLLKVSDSKYFVAMPDGVSPVNALQRALLQALAIGPSGRLLNPVTISESDALSLPASKAWPALAASRLAGLPQQVPQTDTGAATNGGLCARLTSSDRVSFTVPGRSLPSFRSQSVVESETSRRGLADDVVLPPGSAAVVKSADGATTPFLVGDTGIKYAAAGVGDDDILGSFGYSASKAVKLPASVLALIVTGPPLSRTDALRPVSK